MNCRRLFLYFMNNYLSPLSTRLGITIHFHILNSLPSLVRWAELFVNLFARAVLVNQCVKFNMKCTGDKINETSLLCQWAYINFSPRKEIEQLVWSLSFSKNMPGNSVRFLCVYWILYFKQWEYSLA